MRKKLTSLKVRKINKQETLMISCVDNLLDQLERLSLNIGHLCKDDETLEEILNDLISKDYDLDFYSRNNIQNREDISEDMNEIELSIDRLKSYAKLIKINRRKQRRDL